MQRADLFLPIAACVLEEQRVVEPETRYQYQRDQMKQRQRDPERRQSGCDHESRDRHRREHAQHARVTAQRERNDSH